MWLALKAVEAALGADLTGDFCISRIETGRRKGTWEHAEEDVHAGADCAEAAAD